jgi:hypothetical protein
MTYRGKRRRPQVLAAAVVWGQNEGQSRHREIYKDSCGVGLFFFQEACGESWAKQVQRAWRSVPQVARRLRNVLTGVVGGARKRTKTIDNFLVTVWSG